MTQDERWLQQWQTVMDFMEANKRRPSKFVDEETGNAELVETATEVGVNAGALKEERMEKFKELVEMGEKHKRVNQYQ